MASFLSSSLSRSTKPFLRYSRSSYSRQGFTRTFSRSSSIRNIVHEQQHQQYKAKRESKITPLMVLLGVTPIITFALGTWQIQRLKWKVNLIDELHEKLQRPPMELPNFVNVDVLKDFTFRKVHLKGRWDHAHTILITPKVYDGTKGVKVITPLIRQNGSTVLVDRGFVSDEYANQEYWQKPSSDPGEVEIHGMLRTSQNRNFFTPDNHPEKGEWYWVDVDTLVEYAGGEAADVQPVFIEAIFEGHPGQAQLNINRGIPVGRAPIVEVRNSHAAYVATWYSLSAFTAFMFVHLLRKRARAPTKRMPRK